MAFDGIVTKAIVTELQELVGSKIDKVHEPDKNTIVLGLYSQGKNYALNICIDAHNCRLNLTTHNKLNPLVAPNFCMLLRKHLIGGKISGIFMQGLERIVNIEIETINEFNDIILESSNFKNSRVSDITLDNVSEILGIETDDKEIEFDIMIEAKKKDIAMFKLIDDIKSFKPEYLWIDKTTLRV